MTSKSSEVRCAHEQPRLAYCKRISRATEPHAACLRLEPSSVFDSEMHFRSGSPLPGPQIWAGLGARTAYFLSSIERLLAPGALDPKPGPSGTARR